LETWLIDLPEEEEEEEFIFHRKTTVKRPIINNDFTLWKAAGTVKVSSTLATYDKY